MEKEKVKKQHSSHSVKIEIPLSVDLSSVQRKDFIIGLLFVLEDFYGSYALGFVISDFLQAKIASHK